MIKQVICQFAAVLVVFFLASSVNSNAAQITPHASVASANAAGPGGGGNGGGGNNCDPVVPCLVAVQ